MVRALAEDARQHQATANARRVSLALPYPLDPATAGAVERALARRVVPWEEVADHASLWLEAHLAAQGRRRLPVGAYLWREGIPTPSGPTERDVRARFASDAAFGAFREGGFNHGFADVPDAEWDAHDEPMVVVDLILEVPGGLGEVSTGPTAALGLGHRRCLNRQIIEVDAVGSGDGTLVGFPTAYRSGTPAPWRSSAKYSLGPGSRSPRGYSFSR